MPVTISLTEDKYVAVIALIPGEKNREIISFEQITALLDEQKFNYFSSMGIIEQTVNLFNKTRSNAHRIRIFDDRFKEIEQFVKVKIASDEMNAWVNVNMPTELMENFNYEMIKRILKNNKISNGIIGPQLAKLQKQLETGNAVEEMLVASGTPEILGEDGYLKHHELFSRKETIKKMINSGETRKLIQAEARITSSEITPNTVLLTKYLPVDGKEGSTITNKKIWSENNKHRGADPPVVISKNITAKRYHDRIEYIATVRGIGYILNDRIIEVEEVFDGEFQIVLTDDKMEAYLNLQAPKGGKAIDLKDVEAELERLKLGVPIDRKLLDESLSTINEGKEERLTRIVIARGELPENGDNGKLLWNQKLESLYKPKLLENGSVDYRGGSRFPFVREGKVAGIWFLATDGKKNGINVLGQEIEPESGIEIDSKLGDTFILEDSTYGERPVKLLKAKISGLLKTKKKDIYIDPVFEVKTVDYSTGNIDFDGTLVIKDTIADGFQVRCTKDIHILGNVGACTIESDGDIIIKGGINGGSKGFIKALGDIYVKYVENASLLAYGNIYVQNHCVLSQMISKKMIMVGLNKSKGKVIGSELYAWDRIETNLVGSEKSAADSFLSTGIDKELYDIVQAMKARQEELKMEISKLRQGEQKLQKSLLPHKEKIESIQMEINEKTLELNESLEKFVELSGKIYNEKPGDITVKDEIFSHTALFLGKFDKMLYDNQKKMRFVLDNNRILNESLSKSKGDKGGKAEEIATTMQEES